MHVCKILSLTKRKPFEGYKENIEVLEASVGSCCAQILWMKATLNDFRIKFKKVSLLCDNESAIKLTNNPVQHARTKHINNESAIKFTNNLV